MAAKLKVDPKRQKLLQEIKTASVDKLKKVEAPKVGAEKESDQPNILSSIGSLATKIAKERKERNLSDMKKRSKPPQQVCVVSRSCVRGAVD